LMIYTSWCMLGCMKRTQIYLTLAQHEYLAQKAKKNETSISNEIRKTIDFTRHNKQLFYKQKTRETAGQFLLKLSDELSGAGYKVSGKENAVTNFEQYLLDDYERIKNYYR